MENETEDLRDDEHQPDSDETTTVAYGFYPTRTFGPIFPSGSCAIMIFTLMPIIP